MCKYGRTLIYEPFVIVLYRDLVPHRFVFADGRENQLDNIAFLVKEADQKQGRSRENPTFENVPKKK